MSSPAAHVMVTPPHAARSGSPPSSTPSLKRRSPPSRVLRLFVVPASPAARSAVKAKGHKPKMQMNLAAGRAMRTVVAHLVGKWGVPGSLKLEPARGARAAAAWDEDASVDQVYEALGRPEQFFLSYSWDGLEDGKRGTTAKRKKKARKEKAAKKERKEGRVEGPAPSNFPGIPGMAQVSSPDSTPEAAAHAPPRQERQLHELSWMGGGGSGGGGGRTHPRDGPQPVVPAAAYPGGADYPSPDALPSGGTGLTRFQFFNSPEARPALAPAEPVPGLTLLPPPQHSISLSFLRPPATAWSCDGCGASFGTDSGALARLRQHSSACEARRGAAAPPPPPPPPSTVRRREATPQKRTPARQPPAEARVAQSPSALLRLTARLNQTAASPCVLVSPGRSRPPEARQADLPRRALAGTFEDIAAASPPRGGDAEGDDEEQKRKKAEERERRTELALARVRAAREAREREEQRAREAEQKKAQQTERQRVAASNRFVRSQLAELGLGLGLGPQPAWMLGGGKKRKAAGEGEAVGTAAAAAAAADKDAKRARPAAASE